MALIRTLLSWVLALFLALIFIQANLHPLSDPPAGMVKLFDLPGENIIFQTLAERSGIALFEPTGRLAVAIAELLAALLLILPFTRRAGAILAFLILGAAVGFHLSPWLGIEVPVSLKPGETGTDGGGLFSLAVASLVAALLVILVHPGRKREPEAL